MEIYLLTNSTNGKLYVGQTTLSTKSRWARHVAGAKGGLAYPLYRAMRECGTDAFKVETLCHCPDKTSLDEAEKFFIWILGTRKPYFGYNLTLGGSPHNAEWKQKVSLSMKGRVFTDEHREKIRAAATGRKMGPISEEHKRSISAHHKGRVSPSKGMTWKLSEEACRRIGERHKGKPLPEELRKKMSEAAKRRFLSEEGKANLERARSIHEQNCTKRKTA